MPTLLEGMNEINQMPPWLQTSIHPGIKLVGFHKSTTNQIFRQENGHSRQKMLQVENLPSDLPRH
ncbi:hypothetical protein FRC02_010349 [Tulasnella sp. 418]|nr:hypothetical protein FRC02_010349 [Tulasnella sp. 418]